MGKEHTCPVILDDLVSISTSSLSGAGMFKESGGTGIIKIKMGNRVQMRIAFKISLSLHSPYILFLIEFNGYTIDFFVNLVKTPSNLGVGYIYYFVCPVSNKRCKKLFLFNNRLMGRNSIDGCYKSQTYSKKDRDIHKFIENYYLDDEIWKEIYSKYFKTYYKGIPTKRYNKLLSKLKILNRAVLT